MALETFTIYRNSHYTVHLDPESPPGTPTNLTGYTGEFRAKWPGGSLNKALDWSAGSPNRFTLNLLPADTVQIPDGPNARFEIIFVSPSAVKTTVLVGRIDSLGGF